MNTNKSPRNLVSPRFCARLFFFLLSSFFSLLLLSCPDSLFNIEKQPNPGQIHENLPPLAPGYGYFSFKLPGDEARNITPIPEDEFDKIEVFKLIFTNTATGSPLPEILVPFDDPYSPVTVPVPVGEYDLEIFAYFEDPDENPSAEPALLGTAVDSDGDTVTVTITEGTTEPVTVHLKGIIPVVPGTGTFEWDVKFNLTERELEYATITVDASLLEIDLTDEDQLKGSQDFSTGSYSVIIRIKVKDYDIVVLRPYLHIYQNLTSLYNPIFTDANFVNKTNSPSNAYEIWDEDDLRQVGKNGTGKYAGWTLSAHYKVMQPIALTSDIDWEPIGLFNGSFNGNNKTITNLTITNGTSSSGLFSKIEIGGHVHDLGLVNVDITTSVDAGGIAGINLGTIENCYVAGGTITGGEETGGIAGINGVMIKNCYVTDVNIAGTGVISNAGGTGGIAGFNIGTIENCYTNADVSDTSDFGAGGIAGANYHPNALISSSYVIGNVYGKEFAGGIVGVNIEGTVEYSVALNLIVICDDEDYAGRITGGNGNTLTTNRARSDMLVNGVTVSSSNATSTDGADIKIGTDTYNTAFAGFNSDIWNIPAGENVLNENGVLPTLIGVGGAQDPRLPKKPAGSGGFTYNIPPFTDNSPAVTAGAIFRFDTPSDITLDAGADYDSYRWIYFRNGTEYVLGTTQMLTLNAADAIWGTEPYHFNNEEHELTLIVTKGGKDYSQIIYFCVQPLP